ncbi:MAG: RICIN domain-containing protein [Spirochaetales bacterium]|nr:RICIN domain-containing protein [Spirochaetales bacterium]
MKKKILVIIAIILTLPFLSTTVVMAVEDLNTQFPVIVPNGLYQLEVQHSHQVLDVAYYSYESGANIQQWWDINEMNQKWQVTHVSNGCYRITAHHSGMALAVEVDRHGSAQNASNVVQRPVSNETNQLWGIVPHAFGHYQIVSCAFPTLCLDVSSISKEGGANVQLWEQNNYYNQQWALNPVSPVTKILPEGTYLITSKHSSKALNVAGASMADLANIEQLTPNGTDNQIWVVENQDYGFYRIKAYHSGKVLDVQGGLPEDSTNIIQYSWVPNYAQLWKIVDVGGGYYKIISGLHQGKGLDVAGFSVVDHGNIQLYEYLSSPNQKWRFIPIEPTDPDITIIPGSPIINSPFEIEITGSSYDTNVSLVIYDKNNNPTGGVFLKSETQNENGTVTRRYEAPTGLSVAGRYHAIFTADNFTRQVCSKVFDMQSPPPGASAKIIWHPGSESRKIGNGSVNLPLKIRFESTLDLGVVSFQLSPGIASFVQVDAGSITYVEKEKEYELSLSFRIPANASEGLYGGTLSLLSGGVAIPVPFEINLEVDYENIKLNCGIIKLPDQTLAMLKSYTYTSANTLRLEFLPNAPLISELSIGDLISAPSHPLMSSGFACKILYKTIIGSIVILETRLLAIDEVIQEGNFEFYTPLLNDSFTIEAFTYEDCIKVGFEADYALNLGFSMGAEGECAEPSSAHDIKITFSGHVAVIPFFEGLAEKEYGFEEDIWKILKDKGQLSFLEFEIPINIAGIPFTICVSPYLKLSGSGKIKAQTRAEAQLRRDFTITLGYFEGDWRLEDQIVANDKGISNKTKIGMNAKVNFDIGLKSQILPGVGAIKEVISPFTYEVGPFFYIRNTLELKSEIDPATMLVDCGLFYKAWLNVGLKIKNKFFELIDHKEEKKLSETRLLDCSSGICSSLLEAWSANPDGKTFGTKLDDGSYEAIISVVPCGALDNIQTLRGADLNGDGLEDLLIFSDSDYVVPGLSNGDGTFDFDINDDGQFDLTNDSFSPWVGYHLDMNMIQIADVTGDSWDDIIHPVNDSSGGYINIWISKGDGTFIMKTYEPYADNGLAITGGPWLIGDVNGDGKNDLVHPYYRVPPISISKPIYTHISQGGGLFVRRETEERPGRGEFFLLDVNNDNRDDVIQLRDGTSRVWYSNGNGTYVIREFQTYAKVYGPANGRWFGLNNGIFYIDNLGPLAFYQETVCGFQKTHDLPGNPNYQSVYGNWSVQENSNSVGDQLWHRIGDDNINIWNFNFPIGGYSYDSFQIPTLNKNEHWVGLDFNGDGRKDILHIDKLW